MTLSEIKQLLAERNFRPLKQLGQNFLHDRNVCEWIVRAATEDADSPGDILEIGPGLGALTVPLLEAGWKVIAIEKDRGFAAFLRERHGENPNFTLLEGDALEVLPAQPSIPRRIIGNLPYNVSTPLLMTLLDAPEPPRIMTFTVQRELAERLAAAPGSKIYGSVSVILQAAYRIEILKTLAHSVFFPQPDVESAVVRMSRPENPGDELPRSAAFRAFVKQGFSQRRKKLSNLLPVNDSRRAEELSVAGWIQLYSTRSS